jgi:hypothetical protein
MTSSTSGSVRPESLVAEPTAEEATVFERGNHAVIGVESDPMMVLRPEVERVVVVPLPSDDVGEPRKP